MAPATPFPEAMFPSKGSVVHSCDSVREIFCETLLAKT